MCELFRVKLLREIPHCWWILGRCLPPTKVSPLPPPLTTLCVWRRLPYLDLTLPPPLTERPAGRHARGHAPCIRWDAHRDTGAGLKGRRAQRATRVGQTRGALGEASASVHRQRGLNPAALEAAGNVRTKDQLRPCRLVVEQEEPQPRECHSADGAARRAVCSVAGWSI